MTSLKIRIFSSHPENYRTLPMVGRFQRLKTVLVALLGTSLLIGFLLAALLLGSVIAAFLTILAGAAIMVATIRIVIYRVKAQWGGKS